MRRVVMGLGGLALGLAAAGEGVAQSRVVVPIIIQRPAGTSGVTETRVYGQGAAPAPAPRATPGTSFSTSPSSTREIRVLRPGGPATGGKSPGSGATGFFTTPQTTQEIRIFTQGGAAADPGPARSFHTSPAKSQEIRVFGNTTVETPIVILPE